MASLIDLSGLTLNTQEATEMSQCVFEKVEVKPEITTAHSVRTGITMDTQIPFFGKFGLVGKIDPGSCSVNEETQTISTSEKVWSPKKISFRLTHCQDNISEQFKLWEKAKKVNPDEWEMIENPQMAFLEDRLLDATKEAILRISDWSDTAADNVTDGGEITDGVDPSYFSMLSGMWKQIETGVAGSTIKKYTIAENAEATKALQLALADDRALQTFRYLYNNADPRLLESGNLVFHVTRTIANNWRDMLEDKSLVFTLDRTEAGSSTLNYRGIPIVTRYDWDRNISAYYDQGATYLNPSRVVLTDLNNIPIGVPETESFSKLDAWYERKDKKHYIDVAFRLDSKVLEDYMIAVAY